MPIPDPSSLWKVTASHTQFLLALHSFRIRYDTTEEYNVDSKAVMLNEDKFSRPRPRPRPRTNRRGQGRGRGQTFEAEDEAEDKT